MNRRSFLILSSCLIAALAMIPFTGCHKQPTAATATEVDKPADTPTFILAWSEYPSSAVFPVAMQRGLISKEPNKLGTLEQKWNVKLILKEGSYDSLSTLYGAKQVDAVCIVNLDCLPTAVGRPGVALLPVSMSDGGDAVLGTKDIQNLDDLKKYETHGFEKSVSQFCFERGLEVQGKNPADYKYVNMDVEQAALAMQTHQKGIESIAIFNPYILQTTRTNPDSHVLFDSSLFPSEIVDVVWAGKDSLAKPGGDRFGALVCDVFYTMNKQMADPATHQEIVTALGSHSTNLTFQDMDNDVLKKTVFYPTPEHAIALLDGDFQHKTTPLITQWAVDHKVVDTAPTVGFDTEDAQVNFSTKYIHMSVSK